MTGGTGATAARVALFTLALHEIGHFVGLVGGIPDPLLITDPLPYAGTAIQTISSFGAHIDNSQHFGTLMGHSIDGATRRLLTDIDILAVAQNGGLEFVNFNPAIVSPVPEPTTIVLLGGGLLALPGILRIRRKLG